MHCWVIRSCIHGQVQMKMLSDDEWRWDQSVIELCYTLILDLKILIQIPLLFSNTFKFTMFSAVLQLHTLLLLSFNFCIKSYKRVFWSFPTMEPIFQSLHLSLSLFVQIICSILYKTTCVCIWVSLCQFESFFLPPGAKTTQTDSDAKLRWFWTEFD